MAAPPAPRAAQALANESRGTPGSAAGAHAHPEDNVRSAPPAAKRGRWAGEQLDSADGGAFTASERAQVHTAAPQGTAAGSSATQEPFPPERVAARNAWLGRVLAVIQGRADDAAALPPEPSTTHGSAREWLDTIDDTKEQCTPLMHAAKRGRVRILTALITRYHANVNFQSPRSGYTALIVAAFSGHAACVSALLSHGASTRARNRYGEDALRVATSRGYTSIMSALREAEAAAGMRLSEAAAAAAASSAHTAGDAQDVALPKVGMAMRLRGVQPDDTGVLRALYKLGQADHIHDAASARIHNSWTDRILSSDFANPYESYATQPRTAMWVATLAPADALRLLHAPAAAAAGTAGVDSVAPCDCSASTAPRAPESSSTAALSQLLVDAQGRVVIGAVALRPIDSLESSVCADPWHSRMGELCRMVVHPGIRRAGVASTLVRHLEARAAAARYSTILLSTLASMPAATSLYAALGYERTNGEGRNEMYHGDAITIVEFQKLLPCDAAAPAAS